MQIPAVTIVCICLRMDVQLDDILRQNIFLQKDCPGQARRYAGVCGSSGEVGGGVNAYSLRVRARKSRVVTTCCDRKMSSFLSGKIIDLSCLYLLHILLIHPTEESNENL